MRKTDIAAGLFLIAAGLVAIFVIIPAEISGHSDYGLAPDFFPRLLMWLFVGFAAVLVVHRGLQAWRGQPDPDGDQPPMKLPDWAFIAGISVFLAIVYVLMVRVGFIVAGIVTVSTVGVLMGSLRANPIRLAVISIAAPFAIFYAFRHLFLVFLPS